MTTSAERDFVSVGRLAADVQKPVRDIERAAETLKIRAALRLNKISYYNAAQVSRLTKHLNRNGQR
jgi:predicted XRE-type DNA-binding protein